MRLTTKYKNAHIHESYDNNTQEVAIQWPDYSLTYVKSVRSAKITITKVEALEALTRSRAKIDHIFKMIDKLKGL